MAERLRGAWSEAVEASLAEKDKPAPGEELTGYLRDGSRAGGAVAAVPACRRRTA